MTRTELLTNLINDHLTNNHFMTVDRFRDLYLNGLPGKLALLAISRDGQHVLPVFDTHYLPTTELIDYNVIRNLLGTNWTPVVAAHVWHRYPGYLPQTMLTTDGIVDEKVLVRIFGNDFNTYPRVMGMVDAFNFGDYDFETLPRLAVYTIDNEGARRIRIGNDVDEGRVFGVHLDVNGYIRYLDRETGHTMYARMEIGRDNLVWNKWPIKV